MSRTGAGVIPGNLAELGDLATAGVRGFKCFLTDSGNPNFPHLNADDFRRAVSLIAELDAVLLVHAESHQVIEASPRACGRGYASFLASRPDTSEEDAVALVIDSARETGARVHVVHVSSARVLPMLAEAKRSGVRITAETCPHYLIFTAEDIPDGATQFAACPPIRNQENRGLLWQGLADGTLDMIVSDHSPCAPSMKADGDFGQRLRRNQFARDRTAGRVDTRRRARVRARGAVPVDVGTACGPRGARRQGTDSGRASGGFVRIRSRW